MKGLSVRDLAVSFGSAPGLENISFDVPPGEHFVLVGASGAGKTTLLDVLAGFARPRAGTVRVDGEDVTAWPPERRPVVQLAQNPVLFPHLTVRENVAFPLRVRRVPGDEARRRVDAVLAAVRMPEYAGRYPSTLSGGQARRVALARAVVARPSVLLLDEPLSALDPGLREEVREAIAGLHADYRPALVMVTHDLDEAGRMADRMGILVGRELAQTGTPAALFRSPGSLAVARFLGLPNECEGTVSPDGALEVGGVRLGKAPDGLAGVSLPRAVRAVFGVDAVTAEVGDAAAGGEAVLASRGTAAPCRPVEGSVTRVLHRPEAVSLRVDTDVGSFEVGAPGDAPAVGARVSLRFRMAAIHLFDAVTGLRLPGTSAEGS